MLFLPFEKQPTLNYINRGNYTFSARQHSTPTGHSRKPSFILDGLTTHSLESWKRRKEPRFKWNKYVMANHLTAKYSLYRHFGNTFFISKSI